MRCLFILFFIATIIISCSKPEKEKKPDVTCLTEHWINQKKAELSSCVCLTGIYQGIYLGQVVYEIRGIDPLCNGINMVYHPDGTAVVNSGEQAAYQSYLTAVQGLQLIWSCSRSG